MSEEDVWYRECFQRLGITRMNKPEMRKDYLRELLLCMIALHNKCVRRMQSHILLGRALKGRLN